MSELPKPLYIPDLILPAPPSPIGAQVQTLVSPSVVRKSFIPPPIVSVDNDLKEEKPTIRKRSATIGGAPKPPTALQRILQQPTVTVSPKKSYEITHVSMRESPQQISISDEENKRKRLQRGGNCYPVIHISHLPNPKNGSFNPNYPSLVGKFAGYSFLDYANEHFQEQKEKKLINKKQLAINDLIIHGSFILSTLHDLKDKEITKQGMEMFSQINKIMEGDKKANLIEQIQQFCDFIIPKKLLHDECYAQLLKQMRNNKNTANIERGWKLLSILCCVIVPNEKLLHCLANWLIDEICKMQGRAGYCLQILQRTSNSKYQRKLAPSFTEIKTVTNCEKFFCNFSSANEKVIPIEIDSSTTVIEAFHTFCDKIKLPFKYRCLFKPVVFISAQDEYQIITKLIGDAIKLAEEKQNREYPIIYIKQVIFLNRRRPIPDPKLYKLLYHQLKQEIISGKLDCSDIIAAKLAAYHIYLDYMKASSALLVKSNVKPIIRLDKLVPQHLVQPGSESNWISVIEHNFTILKEEAQAISKDSAYRACTHLCQNLPFFACCIFDILILNEKSDWPELVGNHLKLVVNEEGISFFNLNLSMIYLKFPFSQILRWHVQTSLNCVEIVIANQTTSILLKTNPMYAKTSLLNTLRGYSIALLERANYAIAVKDHHPDTSKEENKDLLVFNKGDVLTILCPNEGNNWEYGRLKGVTGNFPYDYVNHTLQPHEPVVQDTPTHIAIACLPVGNELKDMLRNYGVLHFRKKKKRNEFYLDIEEMLTYSTTTPLQSILENCDSQHSGALFDFSLKITKKKENLFKYIEFYLLKLTNKSIKNECWLQLMKQTINNNSPEILLNYFELISIISIYFSPNDENLREMIELYLNEKLSEESSNEIINLIKFSLEQFEKRKNNNFKERKIPKKFQKEEIEMIRERKFKLNFIFIFSTAQQSIGSASHQGNQLNSSGSAPSIPILNSGTVKDFSQHQTVPPSANPSVNSIIYPSFHLLPAEPLADGTSVVNHFISSYINFPIEYSSSFILLLCDSINNEIMLDNDKYLWDSIYEYNSWENGNLKFKIGVLLWNFKFEDFTLASVEEKRLVEYLYEETRSRVLKGEFYANLSHLVDLAAISFHASSLSTPHSSNLKEYFPKYVLDKKNHPSLCEKILGNYTPNPGGNLFEDKLNYLKKAQEYYWNCSIFPVQAVGKEKECLGIGRDSLIWWKSTHKHQYSPFKIFKYSDIICCSVINPHDVEIVIPALKFVFKFKYQSYPVIICKSIQHLQNSQ